MAPNVKSVDYHHGSGGYPSREIPPGGPNFPPYVGPSGGGYAGVYGTGEGVVASPYMGYGSPATGGYGAGGLDPAAIFAAYQGGKLIVCVLIHVPM